MIIKKIEFSSRYFEPINLILDSQFFSCNSNHNFPFSSFLSCVETFFGRKFFQSLSSQSIQPLSREQHFFLSGEKIFLSFRRKKYSFLSGRKKYSFLSLNNNFLLLFYMKKFVIHVFERSRIHSEKKDEPWQPFSGSAYLTLTQVTCTNILYIIFHYNYG